MNTKLSKKIGYLTTSICLGCTLFFGCEKNDNPTQINVKADKDEYTQLINEGKPLHLKVYETLNLDIIVKDEDGIESHCAYVKSPNIRERVSLVYSKSDPKEMSNDGKLSKSDAKLRWFADDGYQFEIVVKDKDGNLTKKTLDVYVSW